MLNPFRIKSKRLISLGIFNFSTPLRIHIPTLNKFSWGVTTLYALHTNRVASQRRGESKFKISVFII